MDPTFAALSELAPKAGTVAAMLAVAAMLVAPRERIRAFLAMAGLAAAPGLLIWDMADSPQLRSLSAQPMKAGLAAAVGALGLVALTVVISRNGKVLPYLLAAALPFRVPIEVGGETSNLLAPLYLVVAAGGLAWALPLLTGRATDSECPAERLDWALAAWLAVFGVAALWSDDPSKAMQDAVFFYIPFAVMFTLLRRIEWTPELVRGCSVVLAALALIFSGVAFYEYWTRTLLLNPKLLISNQFHTYFRVNSVFFDPNIFGRFLMLTMIGLAAVILDSRRGKVVLAATAASGLLLTAMVLTLSQSSLLGLVAGFATLAALRWSPKLIGALTLIAALAAFGAIFASGSSGGSLKALNFQSSGRASLVSGGVDLFATRPLGGWGSGSFSTAYKRERRTGSATAVTASHTTPVTVAAEQGILGLLAYIAVLVTGFAAALQRARISTARAAVTAGLVGLAFHSLTYAAFFEDPAVWALLALAVALPVPLTRTERRAERESRRANPSGLDNHGSATAA